MPSIGSVVGNPKTGARFTNKLRGNTIIGYDGILFDFEPSIGFGATALMDLSNSLKSMRVPLEEAVRFVMRPSIRENFDVGGRPTWTVLADSTKKRRGANAKPLVVTGKLRRVASQRNIWTITKTTATITGSELQQRVPYASIQQMGTQVKKTTSVKAANKMTQAVNAVDLEGIPARPFLMIQEQDKEKIREIFVLWLDRRIGATWGKL